MGEYEILYGDEECFADSDHCQHETYTELLDGVFAVLIALMIILAVVGNFLVNALFRVYNIVRRDASVSHIIMSQIAISDLIYSLVCMPMSLSLLCSTNRFTVDVHENAQDQILVQFVGFMSQVCIRVCVLLLSIVSLDHMVILFKPAVHKDYFTLLHIKTSIAVCWVFCTVVGIVPFMMNKMYSMDIDLVSSQWSVYDVFTKDKIRIWAFNMCIGVPILVPAIFITVSNFVLTVKMDVKDDKPVAHNPFSDEVRKLALKLASAPGKIGLEAIQKANSSVKVEVVKTKEDVKKESLRSLRPITTMYVICNFCWFVMLFHEWAMVIHGGETDEDNLLATMTGKKQKSYLKLFVSVLYFLSSALTPILHFTCSYEMRQGLRVLLHGSRSEPDYARLTKFAQEKASSVTLQKTKLKTKGILNKLNRKEADPPSPKIRPKLRRNAFQLYKLEDGDE